MLLNFL
jgi:hypothetical protein